MNPSHVNLHEFLSHVCAVTRRYRFVHCTEAEKNTSLSSTAFRAHDNMFPYKHSPQEVIPITTEDKALATKIIAWARAHYDSLARHDKSAFVIDVDAALTGSKFRIRLEGHMAFLYKAYTDAHEEVSKPAFSLVTEYVQQRDARRARKK